MPSVLLIATAFLAGVVPPHGPALPVPQAPAPSATAAAATDPQLNIAITNGQTSTRQGDRLTYHIKIRNLGTTEASDLRVTQTLPSGLSFVSADNHGAATTDRIAWTLTLKPGAESTLTTVGQVGRTPTDLLRLATVACATTKDGKKPLVCATHSDLLPAGAAAASPPSQRPWYALGAALLVLLAGAVYLLIRRRLGLRILAMPRILAGPRRAPTAAEPGRLPPSGNDNDDPSAEKGEAGMAVPQAGAPGVEALPRSGGPTAEAVADGGEQNSPKAGVPSGPTAGD